MRMMMMMMMMMYRRPPLRLEWLSLILFLLQSTCFTGLQGDPVTEDIPGLVSCLAAMPCWTGGIDWDDPPKADSHLECVNDYLFTINCSLNALPSVNTSVRNTTFWLVVTDTIFQKEYRCPLKNTTAGFFCSINRSLMSKGDEEYTEKFTDLEKYKISVCQSQDSDSEICQLLEEEYEPMFHTRDHLKVFHGAQMAPGPHFGHTTLLHMHGVKPNAPCCLRVSHNSSRRSFTWLSTYEDHSADTLLPLYLIYQLQFYKTGDKHWLRTHHINRDSTTHYVEDEKFEPNTEYAANVRSSPNMAHYQGQWSEWSSEVIWRTEAAVNAVPAKGFIFNMPVMFAVLCTLVVLGLISYGSVRKWRRSTFIPTPAPYFHTLYKDCQGDFKSWVVTQENTADVLKAEEALQIDTLIECMEVQDYEHPAAFQQQFVENRAYSNVPSFDADLLSMQCPDGGAVAQLLDQRRSVRSLPGYCRSCSPAQDSGCWLCSDTSLEKEPAWYCNEYCTLSCLQQAACSRLAAPRRATAET